MVETKTAESPPSWMWCAPTVNRTQGSVSAVFAAEIYKSVLSVPLRVYAECTLTQSSVQCFVCFWLWYTQECTYQCTCECTCVCRVGSCGVVVTWQTTVYVWTTLSRSSVRCWCSLTLSSLYRFLLYTSTQQTRQASVSLYVNFSYTVSAQFAALCEEHGQRHRLDREKYSGLNMALPFPFPPLFSRPLPSLPLEVGPLNPAVGSRQRCKLTQWRSVTNPQPNLVHFSLLLIQRDHVTSCISERVIKFDCKASCPFWNKTSRSGHIPWRSTGAKTAIAASPDGCWPKNNTPGRSKVGFISCLFMTDRWCIVCHQSSSS